jgi:hypothetical protein
MFFLKIKTIGLWYPSRIRFKAPNESMLQRFLFQGSKPLPEIIVALIAFNSVPIYLSQTYILEYIDYCFISLIVPTKKEKIRLMYHYDT